MSVQPDGDDGRLRAKDWAVDPIVSQADAAHLVSLLHYSKSRPMMSVYRHGLYRSGNWALRDLFGAAIWIPPTRPAAESVAGDDWRGVLCLCRLVIDPTVPTNGASFLLGGSMKLIDRVRWPVLLTYADTAHGHTGAIYKATNWSCLGETPAGDTWVSPNGVQRTRRTNKGTKGPENLNVAQMKAAGYTKLPQLPKIKFVHKVTA